MSAVQAFGDFENTAKHNEWLGMVGAFAFVWGLICLIVFAMSVVTTPNELMVKGYSQAQVAYIANTPAWANFANAVAILAGLAGSVALFMRRRAAYNFYALSIFAILFVVFDGLLRGGFEILGAANSGVPTIVVIISIFLFWTAHSARWDGILK